VLLCSENLNAKESITMAEIEKIGLGGKPILRPTIEPSIETSEEVVKPILRPKFDASKFLDSIIKLKSPAPMLRPAGTGKTVVNVRLNKANASIQNLLDRISEAEGITPDKLKQQGKNISPYDAVYGYNLLTPSQPVSSMTLKELFTFQNQLINKTKGTISGKTSKKEGTSAVGKFQIVKNSLFGKGGTPENPTDRSWAGVLKLKKDTVFTPEIQEKIARLALKESGYNDFVQGNKTQEDLLAGIANIWASVADKSGTNKYGQPIGVTSNILLPLINDVKINANGRIIKVTELRK